MWKEGEKGKLRKSKKKTRKGGREGENGEKKITKRGWEGNTYIYSAGKCIKP